MSDVPVEALRTLFSNLSGVPVTHVRWDGEEEPAVMYGTDQAGQITLDVVSRGDVGLPESRFGINVEDVQEELVGQRQSLTISVRADCFIGIGEAFDLLNRVRLRLYRRSSLLLLRDAGLSLVGAPLLINLDRSVDNRAISAAALDVQFMQVITETPPAEDQAGWIEKATTKSAEEIPDAAAEPVVHLPFPRD